MMSMYDDNRPLFQNGGFLHDLARSRERRVDAAVDDVPESELLRLGANAVVDEVVSDILFRVPQVDFDCAEVSSEETQVDVSRDPIRNMFQLPGPRMARGTLLALHVPFVGDGELFFVQPSRFTSSPMPRAHVDGPELVVEFQLLDGHSGAAKHEVNKALDVLRVNLEVLSRDAETVNSQLRGRALSRLHQREQNLRKGSELVEGIGLPIRRRRDAPRTFAVPTVQRRPPVVPRRSAGGPAEPELSMAEYDHVLSVIRNMVDVMERSPAAFKGLNEEALRVHFLVQLNGQYEGMASGETFNFRGKTDILVRYEGLHVFVAECKFWSGASGFLAAVDQLLGYASWRDGKLALLVFNRKTRLSTVLSAIPPALEDHPAFDHLVDFEVETGFRCWMRRPDDPDRRVLLTVLVFEIPA